MARNKVRREKPKMVPAETFLVWIRKLIDDRDGSLEDVGKMVGLSSRRVQAFRDGFYYGNANVEGKKVMGKIFFADISLDVVDRCLCHEGNTFLFELYPDLYSFTDERVA